MRKKVMAVQEPSKSRRIRTIYSILEMQKPSTSDKRPKFYSYRFHPIVAYNMCRIFGAKIQDLCKLFCINESTLMRWRRAHPELEEAITRGQDEYDGEGIEAELRRRCKGYTYYEEQILQTKAGPQVIKARKHMPSSVTAIKYWLTNRGPLRWTERNTTKLEGGIVVTDFQRAVGRQIEISDVVQNMSKKGLEELYNAVSAAEHKS
jgi:hypothetical protein